MGPDHGRVFRAEEAAAPNLVAGGRRAYRTGLCGNLTLHLLASWHDANCKAFGTRSDVCADRVGKTEVENHLEV